MYIVSWDESNHKKENYLLSNTQWLKCYTHAIFGKAVPSRIISIVLALKPQILHRIM
jgi:hypothetical protein